MQAENELLYEKYYNTYYKKPEIDEKGKQIYRIVGIKKGIPCGLEKANLIIRRENAVDVVKDVAKIIIEL
ncbi:MAG: hypothetical protein HFE90_08030 [Firmicutes bacterium]|nr:hypothetical protein [Bacillota bacterium]